MLITFPTKDLLFVIISSLKFFSFSENIYRRTYRQKAEISVFRALGQLYYVAMCWKLSFITKLFEKTMNLTLIVHICLCPCSWSFPLGVSTPPLRFLRFHDYAFMIWHQIIC